MFLAFSIERGYADRFHKVCFPPRDYFTQPRTSCQKRVSRMLNFKEYPFFLYSFFFHFFCWHCFLQSIICQKIAIWERLLSMLPFWAMTKSLPLQRPLSRITNQPFAPIITKISVAFLKELVVMILRVK